MRWRRQLQEFAGEGIADVVGDEGAAAAAAEDETVGGADEAAHVSRDIYVTIF